MFRFIFGTSGSGKTTLAHNILADLCRQGNKKLMMLVPDQSSFATETAFLNILGPKLSREILVFGFSRLGDYVFEKTGTIRENVVDDGIRNILMSMALDELQDVLTIYKGKSKKKSVINLMVHSLKECKKDNITPDFLNDVSEKIGEETLKTKLKETALILESYDSLISNTYIDPLDDLNKLAEIIEETKMFEGYTIVVDSFSGFTHQQMTIIRSLMKQSKDFYATVNIDTECRDLDMWATTNRTRKYFKRIAEKDNIEIGENIVLNEFHRSDEKDIKFLQKNIFGLSDEYYSESSDNISTFIAKNEYEESNYVANQIKKLVVENNYRYSDIAIVTRDSKKYSGILDVILSKNNIPYFMDNSQNIFVSPVVRFICNAIESAVNGLDRESVLAMAKTGLLHLNSRQIADFENYLFVWQINGKDFKNEFANNPSGFDNWTETSQQLIKEIEETRRLLIDPLVSFRENTKDATGLEICKEIYDLLQEYEIPDSINRLSDKLEKDGLIFESQELVRVYNLIMNTLDKLVAVLQDKKLTLKQFKEYFDYKIADIKISDIPRYHDQVAVGTADRIRLDNIKAVFIMGAVEGQFPSIPKTAGIFSENERRLLIQNDVPLTDSLEELSCHEKYLIYCALTSSSEKVFVSCHISDYAGNSYQPSVIIEEINRLFPKAVTRTSADLNEINELWSEKQAFSYLSKNFYDKSAEMTALRNYFTDISNYNNLMESMSSFLENKPFQIENKENAEKLFRKNMNISASQIEKYNLCAFQYFCNYGLRAKERNVASIDAMQFGNIVHYFLEQFLKSHNKEALNQLGDDELKKSIDDILLEYANDNFGGLESKSKSFINLFNRLKKNIFTLIKEIIRQLGYSDFIPYDFELEISDRGNIPPYKIDVDGDHSVSVNGFVDRVDVLEKNADEMYVRIVDYKTGNKAFTLSEVMYGINLQMLIYLRAIINNGEKYYGKKLIPTGILYMPSFTNEISADKGMSEELVTKELDKNFKMNGLILNDAEVIQHMDRYGSFLKLPRKIEDGTYSENIATSQQFEDIFRHIDDVVKSMASELYSGNVAAKPLKGKINGCEYCPYDSVCCRRENSQYKFAQKLSPKEVYQKLGEEVNDELS